MFGINEWLVIAILVVVVLLVARLRVPTPAKRVVKEAKSSREKTVLASEEPMVEVEGKEAK